MEREPTSEYHGQRAFTLVELLVVIAIIGILAGLLLSSLAQGKALAQSTACKSRLGQIGLGMTMYVSDFSHYPLWDGGAFQMCHDKLYPYYPVRWTNDSWNCPVYLARKGLVYFTVQTNGHVFAAGSYDYNWRGVATGWQGCPSSVYQATQPRPGALIQGRRRGTRSCVPWRDVPFTADARATFTSNKVHSSMKMAPWTFGSLNETAAPHSRVTTCFSATHTCSS